MKTTTYSFCNLSILLLLFSTSVSGQINLDTLSIEERHAFELIRLNKDERGILFVENREMDFTSVHDLDEKDILKIKQFEIKEAFNLYGIDSSWQIFSIITSMHNMDAIYTVTEKPAYPITCKNKAIDIKTRNSCVKEFIDLQFDEIFEDQDQIKLYLYISWRGNVIGYKVEIGEENAELLVKIEELKSNKFQFYPGIMRRKFVNLTIKYSK